MNIVTNPATEEVITEFPVADAAAAEAAIVKSVRAQREWARLPLSARRDALQTISEARGEIGGVVECFHYYAGVVDKILGVHQDRRVTAVDYGVRLAAGRGTGSDHRLTATAAGARGGAA